MKKFIFTFFYICLNTLLMTGCYDKVELENRGFVISLGIDKQKEAEGFSISAEFPDVAALASRSSEGETKTVKDASGETISASINKIDSFTSKYMDFGNTKLCVISEDILQDEALLRETADALERNSEISKRIIVMATDKKSSEILKAKIQGEPMIGMFVDSYYKNNESGYKNDLESILRGLRFSGNALIPKITLEDEEIKIGGAAVVKDFKLQGFADDEELRGYLWLKGKARQITAEYNGSKVPLRVTSGTCNQSFYYNENTLTCAFNIKAEGEIEEYRLSSDTLFSDEILKNLQTIYKDIIFDEISHTLRLFYKEYKTDALMLKDTLRKKDYELYKNLEQDFENIISTIEFIINIDMKIRNTGTVK